MCKYVPVLSRFVDSKFSCLFKTLKLEFYHGHFTTGWSALHKKEKLCRHVFVIYISPTRAFSISYETNVTFPSMPYLDIFTVIGVVIVEMFFFLNMSIYICYLLLSLFLWTILNPLHPRMIFTIFGWNSISGSGGEDVSICSMYFCIFDTSSLGKSLDPSFIKLEFL